MHANVCARKQPAAASSSQQQLEVAGQQQPEAASSSQQQPAVASRFSKNAMYLFCLMYRVYPSFLKLFKIAGLSHQN